MTEPKAKYNERRGYNTTLKIEMMKRIRVLAAQLDKRQNDLIEEAIEDLLNKYKMKKDRQ